MPDNTRNMQPFADINLDKLSHKLIGYLRKELDSNSVEYHQMLSRLTGGYETLICRFQLNGVDERLSRPLIIRVFPEYGHPSQALMESTVQNVLADMGYPVPAVHFICTDKNILGGAFFVMDYLEGENLGNTKTPFDQVSDVLGKAHATLHNIDPAPVVRKIAEYGLDIGLLNCDGRLERLRTSVNLKFDWLNEAAEWLSENRPKDPEILSVCHGDFHPMNILIKDGKVQAVLDWSAFLMGDPAMDVAATILLSTVPVKLILPDLDSEQMKKIYLNAYRRSRPIDETNTPYYSAFRSVLALEEGALGSVVWGHPEMVRLLVANIYDITGAKIKYPHP